MSKRIEVLEHTLEQSPYFEFLCRAVESVGFIFADGIEYVRLTGKPQPQTTELIHALGLESSDIGIVESKTLPLGSKEEADLWIEMVEEELYLLSQKGTPVSKLRMTTPKQQTAVPQVETLIQRIFMPPLEGTYPLSDRIELIYGSLFQFQEPQFIWQNEQQELMVLKYKQGYAGMDVLVTAGLSDPNRGSSALEFDNGPASGYGYELMMFLAGEEDAMLQREFIAWVERTEQTKRPIYQGDYLEYAEGRIPGLPSGGFIVVPAIDFPEEFPVAGGFSTFNTLIAVTPEELETAKEDVFIVADEFFEKGYVNYAPLHR
ncbi:suppressor of fused domain protein [Paenibacillus wulumuqiensis]|uniref:suppressor of fused domain protein n=1 Tax=Paenibacillus wulumuqiensis TaxID=1567107 RepID=UPI0006196CA4|nr:suppressor of fused domain protein [Paenibacillus wulumuqiensis]